MLFKKCKNCKREYSNDELKRIELKEKELKRKRSKDKCPECGGPMKSGEKEKKWHGYLCDDKKNIDYLFLVEYRSYDDNTCEAKIFCLDLIIETKSLLEAINISDDHLSILLKSKYQKSYDSEHIFLTTAFMQESDVLRQDVPIWW